MSRLTFSWPAPTASTVVGDGPGHTVVIVNKAHLVAGTGGALSVTQVTGAAQVAGAQAAVAAQPQLLQLFLWHRPLSHPQQDFFWQPLLQQVGAGAQQVGATAGAHAAGAAQVA